MNEPKAKSRKKFTLKRILLWAGLVILSLVVIEAVRLLILRHHLLTYRQYWQAVAAETPPQNALTYVALGDSAAQGIGASAPQTGYVGLLAEALHNKSDRPVHVINISVSGAKVQDVIDKQLPKLQTLNLPSDTVVTLDIGGNDVPGFDADRFRSQIEQLFQKLPPQTVVGDIPYFGGGRYNKGEQAAETGSAIIHELADKYKLRVAPLHDTTKAGDSIFGYAADFFHPNDRGYRNWFKAYWQILDR